MSDICLPSFLFLIPPLNKKKKKKMPAATIPTLAAISYTGGKDCTLALHRIKEQGMDVAVLVTFSPPLTDPKSFKAHSLDIIKKQAEALGLPHTICIIDGPDYLGSYQREIKQLRSTYGVDALVTGDILPVCSNFMERAVMETGVALVRPLWEKPQQELLNDMWQRGFDIRVTCINTKKIPQNVLDKVQGVYDVGKPLTQEGLDAVASHCINISPTGEFGELHTMVLDCPLYKKEKVIIHSEKLIEGIFVYLKINSVELVTK
jgi:diphthine-ammonia ligase